MQLNANRPGSVKQAASFMGKLPINSKKRTKVLQQAALFAPGGAQPFTKSGQFTASFTKPGHFERIATNVSHVSDV